MAIYHHSHSPPSFLRKIISDRIHVPEIRNREIDWLQAEIRDNFLSSKQGASVISNKLFLFLKMHWWNVSRDSRVLVHILFNVKIIF
jgi:hypothetical protein